MGGSILPRWSQPHPMPQRQRTQRRKPTSALLGSESRRSHPRCASLRRRCNVGSGRCGGRPGCSPTPSPCCRRRSVMTLRRNTCSPSRTSPKPGRPAESSAPGLCWASIAGNSRSWPPGPTTTSSGFTARFATWGRRSSSCMGQTWSSARTSTSPRTSRTPPCCYPTCGRHRGGTLRTGSSLSIRLRYKACSRSPARSTSPVDPASPRPPWWMSCRHVPTTTSPGRTS